MNAIVIEHVKVEELPDAWRAKLAAAAEGPSDRSDRGGNPGRTAGRRVRD